MLLSSQMMPDESSSLSQPNPLNNIDSEFNGPNVIDETLTDSNNLDINHLMDNLREEIKSDENIAQKSALLLKLLEVM